MLDLFWSVINIAEDLTVNGLLHLLLSLPLETKKASGYGGHVGQMQCGLHLKCHSARTLCPLLGDFFFSMSCPSTVRVCASAAKPRMHSGNQCADTLEDVTSIETYTRMLARKLSDPRVPQL